MSTQTNSGYLVIGDISGYTSYVAKTELEHSQEVLAELLGLIVKQFQPTLTILRLEGDAVFANAPEGQIPRGETLVETLETTYTIFRDHVRGIVSRTTCECNACRAIPTLDLKFFVHYGDYIVQNISGISELVGTEVNRLFRLTKNHVFQETGWNAYILYTAASLEQIGLEPDGLFEYEESYEHLGPVTTYSVDLHQRFQEISDSRHIVIGPEEAHLIESYDFAAPPALVWEWLNDPRRRNQIDPTVVWSPASRPGGRTRTGASNHCAHGKNAVALETILDWRPFDYVTTLITDENLPYKIFDMTKMLTLQPLDDGQKTRVTWHFRFERLPAFLVRLLVKPYQKKFREENHLLNQILNAENNQERAQQDAEIESGILTQASG
jgi:hypothetical protein